MKNRIAKLPALLVAAAVLTTGAALAGPPGEEGPWRMGPPDAEQRLARLSQELGLDREQSRQMLEVLQAAEADHEAVRARFFAEAGPEICAIRQGTEAEIMALLKPEQIEQYQLLKAERTLQRNHKRSRLGASSDCPGLDD
jgi:Spy/CpxP family protein refolding chaperone